MSISGIEVNRESRSAVPVDGTRVGDVLPEADFLGPDGPDGDYEFPDEIPEETDSLSRPAELALDDAYLNSKRLVEQVDNMAESSFGRLSTIQGIQAALKRLGISQEAYDAASTYVMQVDQTTRQTKTGLTGAAAIIADIRKKQLDVVTDPSEKQRLAAVHGLYDESNKRVG